MSNAKQRLVVKSFSGSETEDMGDCLNPLIRKTPDEIIVHVGTKMVAAGYLNLGNQIKAKLPDTNVSISSLIVRKDKLAFKTKIIMFMAYLL